jgi:hypothetical protein
LEEFVHQKLKQLFVFLILLNTLTLAVFKSAPVDQAPTGMPVFHSSVAAVISCWCLSPPKAKAEVDFPAPAKDDLAVFKSFVLSKKFHSKILLLLLKGGASPPKAKAEVLSCPAPNVLLLQYLNH